MRRRAFTLLEIMVASSLGFLVLAILVLALVPLLQSSRTSLQKLELSQTSLRIRQRLIEDLQSVPPLAINYPAPGPVSHFSLQPVDQVSSTGTTVYANALIVYELDLPNGRLSRRECRPSGLAIDYPNSYNESQLQTFFTQSNLPARVLAAGILTQFQLTSMTSQRQQLKNLHLELQGGGQKFSWDETIALRNGNL